MGEIDEPLEGAAEELRRLVAERVAAVHAKDPGPLAARQAPDLVFFDVLPPLLSRGSEALGEEAQAWFDAYDGEIGYEVRELEISVDGDVGFCSFVYRVTGTLLSGDEVDMWVRATLGCRRIDGDWVIVHDHESVRSIPSPVKR